MTKQEFYEMLIRTIDQIDDVDHRKEIMKQQAIIIKNLLDDSDVILDQVYFDYHEFILRLSLFATLATISAGLFEGHYSKTGE